MDEHIYTRELEADEVICYEDDGKQTTMILEEVRNLPPLTEEETETALHFANTDFSDCPKQRKEELKEFQPQEEATGLLTKLNATKAKQETLNTYKKPLTF